jgi:hypothetical protein
MPVTPGLPGGGGPLPGVPGELSAIRSLLPDPVILLEPAGPGTEAAGTPPTRAGVFSYLPECAIAHFACHAVSHPSDPSQSLLYLHDHEAAPLTVRSLEPIQHDRLRLVFLSACRTAYTADTDLLDEAIHLTSAFLLVGARHVIGTLWEVHDATAPQMAASFYRGLRTAAGALDTDLAACALHDAVREVRDRYPRMPSCGPGTSTWAPDERPGLSCTQGSRRGAHLQVLPCVTSARTQAIAPSRGTSGGTCQF